MGKHYTDIRDKNGKRIFNGDIVRILKNGYKPVPIYIDRKVFFKNGAYRVDDYICGANPTNLLCVRNDIEVIG